MSRKPRIHYTETDKSLMWDHWRKGPESNCEEWVLERQLFIDKV